MFNVERELAYYQQHPTDYTSLLVLQFSGDLRERFYREPYIFEQSVVFQVKGLPRECVADVVTLESKDFEEARERLAGRELVDTIYRFTFVSSLLRKRMISKYLQAVSSLR